MASASTLPAREDFADELRGFALLGIVLVNAPFLGLSGHGYTEASVASGWDRAAALFTVAFAQAKFYVLFAFLFGYSLSFMFKADDPSPALSRRRYRRRLLGLGALGILHALLFFVGDILLLYAVLGTALLWLYRQSGRRVAVAAGVAAAVWALVLLALLGIAATDPRALAAPVAQTAAFDAALRDGTLWQSIVARAALWPSTFGFIATMNGLGVLAMFALGLLAGRHRWLAEPQRHGRCWRWGTWFGLLLGLPLALLSAWWLVGPSAQVGLDNVGVQEVAGLVLGFLSAPLLSWGYVSWLVLARQRWPGVLAWCRRSGRMSLSGYVGESVLLSLIFCGYGLGWFGQLGAGGVLLVALAVWLALDLAAASWPARWAQGPLESLLKRWVRTADAA